jgi:hypothetical protein
LTFQKKKNSQKEKDVVFIYDKSEIDYETFQISVSLWFPGKDLLTREKGKEDKKKFLHLAWRLKGTKPSEDTKKSQMLPIQREWQSTAFYSTFPFQTLPYSGIGLFLSAISEIEKNWLDFCDIYEKGLLDIVGYTNSRRFDVMLIKM